MLVVDAGSLYEMLTRGAAGERVKRRLTQDPALAAPHVLDVEVLGIIRREFLFGSLQANAANQAMEDLRIWPGERFGHQSLLRRAWELRSNVRGWDAMYIALAEALDATLITTDARLARASGPRCRIEVP